MKMLNLLAIIIATALALFAIVYASQSATQTKSATNKGFAVIELFTSEGCSSCPPADALLAKIEKEAGDKPIYVLAYHVDYWDRLGWTDIFSRAKFSERQKQYSNWLSSDVYTPQLVINGTKEYVGSNAVAVQSAVSDALKDSAISSGLHIEARLHADKIDLDYKVKGNGGNRLLVALVQKHAENKVARGENGGRVLKHVQVVREFVTFDLKNNGQGSGLLEIPYGVDKQEWELIGFVQNPATGSIEAVTDVKVLR